ncbi:cryptochrome/photolyase family protein [Phenylobacterium sp.]|uniref:cryptochrome/photolyase family protein n=1 Tax=Phenylobacterium sp. TaxID=1871053 RepID=UPI00374D87EF
MDSPVSVLTPGPAPIIVWFRRDLRLSDNPALAAAVASGRPIVPLYVLDETPGLRAPGAASLWWLDQSLRRLAASLEALGSRLILRRGPAAAVLDGLARDTGAAKVVWNRLYDPGVTDRDTALKAALKGQGVAVTSFNGALLSEPWTVRNKSGEPFKVFTPFWRAARAGLDLTPLHPTPAALIAPTAWPATERLETWSLQPTKPDWTAGFGIWTPGEAGARRRLEDFLATGLARYAEGRDIPAGGAVSRLSPHLHFGEISPRQVWAALDDAVEARPGLDRHAEKFRAELGWREFSHALLFYNPEMESRNFKPAYDAFPWREDPIAFTAWTKGRTGYPMVDAGMRELWATGFMHNRVRMLTASFLVKHLLLDWRLGEAWFWDTLLDADRANNAAGWQWVAGSGADAAPYFRIFSPMGQGEKFDTNGAYVRRWVPELARLPDAVVHSPWTADPRILRAAGVVLGQTYPHPIVDHGFARDRALAALKHTRLDGSEA